MQNRSYDVSSDGTLTEGYDSWATGYDRDVRVCGYATPDAVANAVCRHVSDRHAHLLEAGAGTGLLGEALYRRGYRHLVACDSSQVMLSEASRKGVYQLLCRMELGRPLGFPNQCFDGLVAAGVYTPGHAPARSLFELARLVRPGGWVIFSLKWDGAFETAFLAVIQQLESSFGWQRYAWSDTYSSWPLADPRLKARVLSYRVRTGSLI